MEYLNLTELKFYSQDFILFNLECERKDARDLALFFEATSRNRSAHNLAQIFIFRFTNLFSRNRSSNPRVLIVIFYQIECGRKDARAPTRFLFVMR